jgi:hypothetical protein
MNKSKKIRRFNRISLLLLGLIRPFLIFLRY